MLDKNNAIGVLDSGVGGLSVIKAIKEELPKENIIFFADSLNCPYGNKSKEDIIKLTNNMIEFLEKNDIKIIVIACNTISIVKDELKSKNNIKIIDIISPTVENVVKLNLKELALFATTFTVNSKSYDKLFKKSCKELKLISQDSKILAKLIEDGNFKQSEQEIKERIDEILAKDENIKDIILGCTHYPIIQKSFSTLYPNINFINPAKKQSKAIKEFLEKNKLLSDENLGDFKIYTSSSKDKFDIFLKKLKLPKPSLISQKIL